MKLVTVIYDSGIEPDMEKLLKQHGIEHYTLLRNVHGAGETGIRGGDPVWPGVNNVLLLVLNDDQVQPLITAAHAMREAFPLTPGLKFIVQDAELY